MFGLIADSITQTTKALNENYDAGCLSYSVLKINKSYLAQETRVSLSVMDTESTFITLGPPAAKHKWRETKNAVQLKSRHV